MMRIDLPQCNFKYCRYCFDGNCTGKEIHRERCEFLERAPTVDAVPVRWISVEDKLPDSQSWYFVCFKQGWPTEAWWTGEQWDDFTTCNAISECVTHWMHLPNPPGAKMEREGR